MIVGYSLGTMRLLCASQPGSRSNDSLFRASFAGSALWPRAGTAASDVSMRMARKIPGENTLGFVGFMSFPRRGSFVRRVGRWRIVVPPVRASRHQGPQVHAQLLHRRTADVPPAVVD